MEVNVLAGLDKYVKQKDTVRYWISDIPKELISYKK